jgi:hypothetical protein
VRLSRSGLSSKVKRDRLESSSLAQSSSRSPTKLWIWGCWHNPPNLGGVERIAVVAERGYFKIEDIEACEEAGLDPYVPRPQRGPSVRAGLFRKDEFRYDPMMRGLEKVRGEFSLTALAFTATPDRRTDQFRDVVERHGIEQVFTNRIPRLRKLTQHIKADWYSGRLRRCRCFHTVCSIFAPRRDVGSPISGASSIL